MCRGTALDDKAVQDLGDPGSRSRDPLKVGAIPLIRDVDDPRQTDPIFHPVDLQGREVNARHAQQSPLDDAFQFMRHVSAVTIDAAPTITGDQIIHRIVDQIDNGFILKKLSHLDSFQHQNIRRMQEKNSRS